jgi:hypothetical protein
MHWRRVCGRVDRPLTFCIYSGDTGCCAVQEAVSTLFTSLSPEEQNSLRVLQDDTPARLHAPDFNGVKGSAKTWTLPSRTLAALGL